MKGKARPAKIAAAADAADHHVGEVVGVLHCFFASRPMTVWCSMTWFSTLPSVYFVSSRVTAASTASLMAMPRLPGRLRIGGQNLPAGVGLVRRAGDHVGAPECASCKRRYGFWW